MYHSVKWMMDYEFFKKKPTVFINPKAKSLWMLIVNGLPVFRTEFKHMATDEEIYMLNDGADMLYNELKYIKEKFNNDKEII